MMTTVFGKPRAGKTTFAAWAADRAQRGRPLRVGLPLHHTIIGEHAPYMRVYSNTPIQGCYRLDTDDIGRIMIEDSLIIIDEAGMVYNNRDHKTADRVALNWFRLHGHYRNDIIFISQGNDVDKVIRELSISMLYVVKRGRVSLVTPIERRVVIDGTIEDGYYTTGLANSLILRRKKYYGMFDSWSADKLPVKPPILW